MILGPYRNPPYRSPTPNSVKSSHSPPPHNHNRNLSPKRKRSDSSAEDTPITGPTKALQIDLAENSIDGNAPDSPRSKVASRLKDLEIRQSRPQSTSHLHQQDAAPSNSQSPRKKLKTNSIRDLRGEVQARRLREEAQTPQYERPTEIPDSVGESTINLSEIAETPDAYGHVPRATPTQVRNGIRELNETVDEVMVEDREGEDNSRLTSPTPPTRKRMLSPPPAFSLPNPPSSTDPFFSPNTSFTSSSSSSSSSSDLNWSTALTWQDSEITGHEISAPDDDGEGINGIGFRPTAAIAYARSQRRKQQVSEWKAREAREARQRRMERRRGGEADSVMSDPVVGSQGDGEGNGKRMVRFTAPGAG